MEADPRHAELVIKDFKLNGCKASAVPGIKEVSKKAQEAEEEKKMSAGTKARIGLRGVDTVGESGRLASPTDEAAGAETRTSPRPVDVVADAAESAGGSEWSDDECGIGREPEEMKDEELEKEQAHLYRAPAARLNYIGPDRPDLA